MKTPKDKSAPAKKIAARARGKLAREKPRQKRPRKTTAGTAAGEVSAGAALQTLMELMTGSGSDQVRVTAAKALLDRILKHEESTMDKTETDDERKQRQATLHAIAKLLEDLAAAKSLGDRGETALDQGRPPEPADAVA